MKYLIDRLVVFNTDDGTLHLPSSEDVIRLALPAARLLETFLSSEGRELTREYLLETVWDKHGLHASGNNLNQYVSILRRNLSLLGCHELIITLPKLGFRLNAAISIEILETDSVSPEPSPSIVTSSGHFQRLFFIGSIIITLLTGVAIGLFYYNDADNGETVLHEQHSGCDIYYLKDISDDEKKEALRKIMSIMKVNGIQCKKNDVVIYNSEASLSDKVESREVLSYCHAGKDRVVISCDNFYRYRWDKTQ
ncbi:winged helix-turn-helix domain-containing protein [Enterobacter cloacae]|nr:winged helix-turn-helix domain-containing protein [Enterobacter cloacae]MBN4760378.1 winged helix-turn-helix domain-containing protein [Enterobacter cloacae]MCT2764278.1 winged helix-turn-helix domain-containing protein [Enterobacter cloacae]MCU6311976.1 winged helix-turn-helix domain-containing protein [Enterobacter cloacae]HDC4527649.1 winged helix-turn-helix domain-containing protein [Enterobacter cloacae]